MSKATFYKFALSLFSAFLLIVGTPVQAEISNTFSFQGSLKDTGGNPVNANVDITFAIYDVTSGGSALWSEFQSGVAVANGVINAEVGSVTPVDLPFDKPYYLGLTVGTDSEMTPRQKLTSVPYAIRGKNRTTEVTVECGNGETVGDALSESTPGGWRIITVNGTCQEDVRIRRSKVILQGGTNGKIVGQTAGKAAVEVFAVHYVIVRDITLENGSGYGLLVKNGASARLQNSTVQNHQDYEVLAQTGAVLWMSDSTIVSNPADKSALIVADGSVARISGENSFTSAGTTESTVEGLRGSTIRMYGDNISVENTAGGSAIGNYIGSVFRQDGGHATVNGNVDTSRMSDTEFRDVEISGDVGVSNFGYLRFRDQSGDPNNVTVTGTTNSWGGGHIDFKSGVQLDGDLNCGGGTSSGTPVFLNSHSSNCP